MACAGHGAEAAEAGPHEKRHLTHSFYLSVEKPQCRLFSSGNWISGYKRTISCGKLQDGMYNSRIERSTQIIKGNHTAPAL